MKLPLFLKLKFPLYIILFILEYLKNLQYSVIPQHLISRLSLEQSSSPHQDYLLYVEDIQEAASRHTHSEKRVA